MTSSKGTRQYVPSCISILSTSNCFQLFLLKISSYFLLTPLSLFVISLLILCVCIENSFYLKMKKTLYFLRILISKWKTFMKSDNVKISNENWIHQHTLSHNQTLAKMNERSVFGYIFYERIYDGFLKICYHVCHQTWNHKHWACMRIPALFLNLFKEAYATDNLSLFDAAESFELCIGLRNSNIWCIWFANFTLKLNFTLFIFMLILIVYCQIKNRMKSDENCRIAQYGHFIPTIPYLQI